MVKARLTVTVQPELIKWLNSQIEQGNFADKSHAIQVSIRKLKEQIDKGEIRYAQKTHKC